MIPRNRKIAPLVMMAAGGLLIAGAVILILSIPPEAAPVPTDPPAARDDGVPRVSAGDAKAAYDLEQAVFVDVRAEVYYQQSHIPGALSIPLDELEARLDELDPQDWIITYCTWPNEETSAGAVLTLMENGFTRASAIRGGLDGWLEQGYPVEP